MPTYRITWPVALGAVADVAVDDAEIAENWATEIVVDVIADDAETARNCALQRVAEALQSQNRDGARFYGSIDGVEPTTEEIADEGEPR